jgi:RNA-directed DNA polymerase
MHVLEKSDCAVVPLNQTNKEERSSAETGEGRAQTKENIVRPGMPPTQSGARMSQGLNGVRRAASVRKQERFTALLHHLSIALLRDSFYALKRQASPGLDGMRWQEYETGLEDRLNDLHSRVHRGAYRAQPSRRVYIPKADARQRPLGIAALEEDKIVQQAVVTILNQIYEAGFKGFSYGFRPGRGPHQASRVGLIAGSSVFCLRYFKQQEEHIFSKRNHRANRFPLRTFSRPAIAYAIAPGTRTPARA